MDAPLETLRVALPKGRMYDNVIALLQDAGIRLLRTARSYRPELSLPTCEVKLLKPQNIVEMLHLGSRDIGFAGADWVAELNLETELVELLNTELDPVRIVAAAPTGLLSGDLAGRPLTVASEYERLTRKWITQRGINAQFVRSYGATEVFPPEDADIIVDNTATGATLLANGLEIVDDVLASSTRLYASAHALDQTTKRQRIEDFVMLLRAVLEARKRVMVEFNVGVDQLQAVLGVVPCMRKPTVAPLAEAQGYAVKAAVPRGELPTVIPLIKLKGGTDIVVTRLEQIVP